MLSTIDLLGHSDHSGSNAATYCKLISQFFPGSYGTYPPVSNLAQIGSYGNFKDGIFTLVGQLCDYNGQGSISYNNPETTPSSQNINYTKGKSTTVKWEMKGGVKTIVEEFDTAVDVDAGIDYTFSESNSLMFCGDSFFQTVIDPDPADFYAKIWPMLKGWDDDWVIINQVLECSNFVYVDSSNSNSVFSICGSALALGDFGEGKISSALSIENDSNLNLKLTGYSNPGIFGVGLIKYDHHNNGKINFL
ncbi:MAG: hypothetical protein U0T79_02900 [Ferruginibacter sp.]